MSCIPRPASRQRPESHPGKTRPLLGADDPYLTDKLVLEFNDFLATRDEAELAAVLDALPNPVRMAVNHFPAGRCAPQPGAFNLYGRPEVVREDGSVSWAIQLLSDEVMLPASAELRGWVLLEAMKVALTWTGAEAERNVVREALAIADAAGRNGQWVRVHTVHQSDDEDLESSGKSTFVVDVFDAPIPLDNEDEGAGAFSARFA